MRTSLKLTAFVVVFGVLYICASVMMGGLNDVSKRVEAAVFPNKAEASAIQNATAAEQAAPREDVSAGKVEVSPGIWKLSQ
jgi:hypothetical protein